VALGCTAHGVERPARRRAGACRRSRSQRLEPAFLTRRSASRLHVPTSGCGCASCACALSCGANHGTVARACWGRRATGPSPTRHGACPPRRGGGGVASPTGARTARRRHRPRREGVLLASSEWGINGGRTAEVLQRLRVLLPTPRRAGRARAGQNGAPRGAQAVPGGEALSTKMGDAHAEHAPEGLANTAVAWGTLVSSW